MPPLDPDLAAVLERAPELTVPLRPGLIGRMRDNMAAAAVTDEALRCGGAVTVTGLGLTAPDGTRLPGLLLAPAARPPAVLVCYLHGGGMVTGDERTGLPVALDWAATAGAAVASAGYRLAPEHPYPVPPEDCYAALAQLAARPEFAGLPLVVAGSSAGGGLAAAAVLMARDRGGPALAGQLLMCPMLDDRMDTPSSHELAGGVWDRRSNGTAWASYLGAACGGPDVPAYAAPARAQDLSGLPPAYLDVGSAEVFRDETIDYAARLARAGVLTELHVWPGAFHGFEVLAPGSAPAAAARAARAAYLGRIAGRR